MISNILRAAIGAVRTPRDKRPAGDTTVMERSAVVFHPPGTVRLVTPAEEAALAARASHAGAPLATVTARSPRDTPRYPERAVPA